MKGALAYVAMMAVYVVDRPADDRYTLYETMKRTRLPARPSKLVAEERITIGGVPGLRYIITYQNGARTVEFRDVLVKSRTGYEGYLMMYDYKSETGLRDAGREFLESIQVVSPVETPAADVAGRLSHGRRGR